MNTTETRGAFIILAIALISLGFWTYTQATVGQIASCVNKSGEIRILLGNNATSTACHKNETYLSWNMTGPQGPKGDPGAPGKDGTNGANGSPGKDGGLGQNLHLLDANGQDLGILIDTDPTDANLVVYRPQDEAFLSLIQTGSAKKVSVTNAINIEYLQQNCAGPGYTNEFSNPEITFTSDSGNNRLFKTMNAAPLTSATVLSQLAPGTGCSNIVSDYLPPFYPVQEITSVTFPLVWPLHVVAE